MTNSVKDRHGVAELAGAFTLTAMALMILVSVVDRKFGLGIFRSADQMLPDLLVWTAMLGAAAGVRRSSHLGITLLLDNVGAANARRIRVFHELLTAVFFGALLWFGWEAARFDMDSGMVGVSGYPYWVVSIALPIGSVLALWYAARLLISYLRGEPLPDSSPLEEVPL